MAPATAIREDRSPVEEIANRAATSGAGLAAAAKAVGLADHKRMLEDHARRVRDSHRVQMARLGLELPADEGDDMAGDIFVCGDITNQAPVASSPAATQPVTPQPATGSVTTAAKKIWPYVLAAALGSGGLGAGVMAAINSLTSDAPVVQPAVDTDTEYELRISSGE